MAVKGYRKPCWCSVESTEEVNGVGQGSDTHSCERCAAIEANMPDYYREFCGLDMRRVGVQDVPEDFMEQLREACDAWLRARGVDTACSHMLPTDRFDESARLHFRQDGHPSYDHDDDNTNNNYYTNAADTPDSPL